MRTVDAKEAETQLDNLIKYAENGETTIITQHGTAVAKLSPIQIEHRLRKPGTLKGKVIISDDFDLPIQFNEPTEKTIL